MGKLANCRPTRHHRYGCSLGKEQNAVTLRKALNHLPNQPLYALLGALEHVDLQERLAERIAEKAQQEIESNEPDLFLLSALIRALAGAPIEVSQPILKTILQSPRLSHQEVLIGIAGRTWHLLADADIAEQFLLRLAQTGNQALFNQLFADLVMLPELRMVLLPLLHSSPSEELATALVKLQQATKG